MIPTGKTSIFSLREKTTLAIPVITAMNSSQLVLFNPSMNCCTISCKFFYYTAKDNRLHPHKNTRFIII